MRCHFGLRGASLRDFKKAATKRIWRWNDLFSDRYYWCLLGYTLSDDLQGSFGSFFDADPKCKASKKLLASFDEWEDGHTLELRLTDDAALRVVMNEHTMQTVTLRTGEESVLLSSVDGHPVGPAFNGQEMKVLIRHLCSQKLPFDPRYLWPLLFPALGPSASDVSVVVHSVSLALPWMEDTAPLHRYLLRRAQRTHWQTDAIGYAWTDGPRSTLNPRQRQTFLRTWREMEKTATRK